MGNSHTSVLLIEDDPDDRLLYREMIHEDHRTRFEVEVTDYLEKGEALLEQRHFDVVLLDLSLPDSQGFDTFETLHDFVTAPPIVVLTGHDDEELGLRAVREGAQDYLVKGQVNSNLLIRAIRYAIERKRIQRQQALESRILKLLGAPPVDEETLHQILTEIQQALPVRAVGIRMREDHEDYPFAAALGFSEEFLHEASNILPRDDVEPDESGQGRVREPECMCAMVICGKVDPARPYFTEAGSFWTNTPSETVREICEDPGHGEGRRLCMEAEDEPLALVPIPNGAWHAGLLYVRMVAGNELDAEIVKFLEDLGESIGIALARERAAKGMRTYAERLEGLREVDEAILSAGSLEEIARAALRRTGSLLPFDHASVVAFDEEGDEGKVLGFYHHHGDGNEVPASEAFAAALAESVRLARGIPVVVENVSRATSPSAIDRTLAAAGIRAYISVPLIATNELIGCLNIGWEKPTTISGDNVEIAEELGEVLSIAIGQRREQQRREKAEHSLRQVDYEMGVARDIQQRLYPHESLRVGGYEIGGHCEPAHHAGGDYYDYLELPDGSMAICIGDVVGHGVGAAVLMASIRSYIHAFARTTSNLAEIMQYVNALMYRETPPNLFCSLCLVRLDPSTPSLSFVNAGHPAGQVTNRDGTWRMCLDSTTFPLGLLEDPDFPSGPEISLESGELVSLFTDGVMDATSTSGVHFKDNAEKLIAENRDRPARDIAATVCEEVQNWCKPRDPRDDITAVVIKVL